MQYKFTAYLVLDNDIITKSSNSTNQRQSIHIICKINHKGIRAFMLWQFTNPLKHTAAKKMQLWYKDNEGCENIQKRDVIQNNTHNVVDQ